MLCVTVFNADTQGSRSLDITRPRPLTGHDLTGLDRKTPGIEKDLSLIETARQVPEQIKNHKGCSP